MKQTDEKGNPLTYWGGLEEPKQETLEEAAMKHSSIMFEHEVCDSNVSFKAGAKWQQEQDKNKYSEEDMKRAFNVGFQVGYNDETSPSYLTAEKFIKQFKNK